MIDSGRFPWGAHSQRFPQIAEGSSSMWSRFGPLAFSVHCRYEILKDIGSCLGPFAAQQLLLGIETLSLRAERHASNAMKIAQWLQVHPGVAWVSYPGLKSHPSHKLAKKYLINGFGAVVTFGIKGGAQQSRLFVDELKLVTNTAK